MPDDTPAAPAQAQAAPVAPPAPKLTADQLALILAEVKLTNPVVTGLAINTNSPEKGQFVVLDVTSTVGTAPDPVITTTTAHTFNAALLSKRHGLRVVAEFLGDQHGTRLHLAGVTKVRPVALRPVAPPTTEADAMQYAPKPATPLPVLPSPSGFAAVRARRAAKKNPPPPPPSQ